LGIALTVRIGHIDSDPYGGFEGEVAAILGSVGFLLHRVCHAVANIHVLPFASSANLGLPLL